jgi:hypothetical protein
MRYGAVPIAAKVGGLADTIVDSEDPRPMQCPTGMHFLPVTPNALEAALHRARRPVERPSGLAILQANAMQQTYPGPSPPRLFRPLFHAIGVLESRPLSDSSPSVRHFLQAATGVRFRRRPLLLALLLDSTEGTGNI